MELCLFYVICNSKDGIVFERRISLLVLIILLLTMQWLLSLFGQSILPGVPHTGSFIYMLSVLIVVLIIVQFML